MPKAIKGAATKHAKVSLTFKINNAHKVNIKVKGTVIRLGKVLDKKPSIVPDSFKTLLIISPSFSCLKYPISVFIKPFNISARTSFPIS